MLTNCRGEPTVKVNEIKEIAKLQGIKAGRLTKTELIRAIQQAEGNFVCYDTNSSKTCGQDKCLWREDCV
jgi:hypothetical protein